MATWSQSELPVETSAVSRVVSDLLNCVRSAISDVDPEDVKILQASASSYARWWKDEFSIEHDPSQLHGESNHFRYRAHPCILLRASGLRGMSDTQLVQVCLAAATCKVAIHISVDRQSNVTKALPFPVIEESEMNLINRLPECASHYGILRVVNPSVDLQRAANDASFQTITSEPLANGRLELLAYLREQSISETTHRYGNLILKAEDILKMI